MLEPIIDGIYNIHIPHNRLHMHMLSEGLAIEEERKKKKRKWVRYERKHSMSAGHIDWQEDEKDSIKVCAVLDDASWKILAVVNMQQKRINKGGENKWHKKIRSVIFINHHCVPLKWSILTSLSVSGLMKVTLSKHQKHHNFSYKFRNNKPS